MKNYLPLALGLALGNARAEEPRECIDKLNLTVEVKPSVARLMNSAKVDKVIGEVKDFYTREVNLPVSWKYQIEREQGDIRISFGTIDDCMQDWFHDSHAIIEYLKNNGTTESRQKLEDVKLDPLTERRIVQHQHDLLLSSNGIADPIERKVYVFPQQIMMEMGAALLTNIFLPPEPAYTSVTAHELGHVLLGLGHAKMDNMDGTIDQFNIMYRKGSHPMDKYNFSADDKLKIQSQICKPEETQ